MEPNSKACKVHAHQPRLCVLTTTYPIGESDPCPPFVYELCQRLTAHFAVTVIAPAAVGARTGAWHGVEVIRYRYAPARFQTLASGGGILPNLRRAPWRLVWLPALILGQAWTLWRHRHRFDLIHAHWLIPQGLIAVALAGPVPVICTSHGADVFALRGRLWDGLRRWVLQRAAASTAVGLPLQKNLQALAPQCPVALLPMGIDMKRFHPQSHARRVPGRLLFVGRLVPKKGLRLLMAALPLLGSEGRVRELHVVGDGPERADIEAMAALIAMPIHFHGALPSAQLPDHYNAAALVVLPFCTAADGDEEGLGLTLIEALACGCKVVSGVSQAQAAIPETPGWWRCDAQAPEILAAVISRALAADLEPDVLQAARAQMLEPFGWTHLASAYIGLLQGALVQRGSA